MYDQSKQSELIRFARVGAGATVIDVYPAASRTTGRACSPDVVGPGKGGSFSFVPGRSRPLQERSGRPDADAGAGAGPRERRSRLGGRRGDIGGHAARGCLVAAPVLPRSPHRADPGQGRDGGCFQSRRLGAAKARWVLRHHRRPRRRRSDRGTSDTQKAPGIGSTLRPSGEEVEAAGFVLDAESTLLANKDDPHSVKVFDPSIKDQTDRFAYRFVKP